MPSIKDLKKRITSTKTTQQTTKAMKMVSAAKLRRAQDAIMSQRPYAKQLKKLMELVSGLMDGGGSNSPLLGRDVQGGGKPRLLILVVTSDRGLCAGFNSNVIKGTQKWIAANSANYDSVTMSFLGRRGHDFFKSRKPTIDTFYADLGGKVTFAKAKKLADSLVGQYVEGKYDEIKIVYNEFRNAVTQDTRVEAFLPLKREAVQGEKGAKPAEAVPPTIVRPSPTEVFESLLAKNFPAQTFRIMLESQAGEHGARMSAMENATKNAGEMIKKLSLQYNKQRQAGITKELLEIISGSESQKG